MEKAELIIMDRTAAFYSIPTYTHGGGIPIFSGSRRQRGGSIFGSLKRFFMPILYGLGKKVAKQGARQAVGLAKDVVGDAFMFRNVNDSVKRHGKRRALNLTRYAADEGLGTLEKMIGSGRRRRKRRAQSSRKRKQSTKRTVSQRRKSCKTKRRRTKKPLF